MKVIEYSKANGFSDIEIEDWKDTESETEWLARIGFEAHGDHDGLESEREYGQRIEIRHAARDATHGFVAMVEMGACDGPADFVLVRSRADLLQLRMTLAPFHAVVLMRRFDALVSIAEKTFEAWHGHDHEDDCRECDSRQVHLRESIAKPRAAEKAKGAAA